MEVGEGFFKFSILLIYPKFAFANFLNQFLFILLIIMLNCLDFLIIVLLVLLSGLFSGLTLGLLGLDKTDLERKIKVGNKYAKKIYPLRKRGNLLLCTLLLGNVAVNATIAIFLGNISSGIIAGVVSTGLITIFGEIIPQASISRYALVVGAKTTWLVKIFMVVLFPVCFPIAKILDKILGEEMPTIWSRRELEEIIRMHEDSPRSNLDADEERIILGAMSFSDKNAEDVMTPRSATFMLDTGMVIDDKLKRKIKKFGFTRIPVYRKSMDKIVGILFAKDLIGLKSDKKTVGSVCRRDKFFRVNTDKKLDVLLNRFIREKTHITFVYDKEKKFVGIVTLEDIIEEVLKKEIVDEDDLAVSPEKVADKIHPEDE